MPQYKPKRVSVEKVYVETWYQSEDGTLHPTEDIAIFHDKQKNNQIKTCPTCKGSRGRMDLSDEEGRLPLMWYDCNTCNGRGYLELQWS